MPAGNGRCQMSFDMEKLQAELIRDEGLRLSPYRDSLGYLTIGVGHRVQKGEKFGDITNYTAMGLLELDISIALRRLDNIYPQWRELDDVRQRAMVNLTFNLGYRLADFHRFLHALKGGDGVSFYCHQKHDIAHREVIAEAARLAELRKAGDLRGVGQVNGLFDHVSGGGNAVLRFVCARAVQDGLGDAACIFRACFVQNCLQLGRHRNADVLACSLGHEFASGCGVKHAAFSSVFTQVFDKLGYFGGLALEVILVDTLGHKKVL